MQGQQISIPLNTTQYRIRHTSHPMDTFGPQVIDDPSLFSANANNIPFLPDQPNPTDRANAPFLSDSSEKIDNFTMQDLEMFGSDLEPLFSELGGMSSWDGAAPDIEMASSNIRPQAGIDKSSIMNEGDLIQSVLEETRDDRYTSTSFIGAEGSSGQDAPMRNIIMIRPKTFLMIW